MNRHSHQRRQKQVIKRSDRPAESLANKMGPKTRVAADPCSSKAKPMNEKGLWARFLRWSGFDARIQKDRLWKCSLDKLESVADKC